MVPRPRGVRPGTMRAMETNQLMPLDELARGHRESLKAALEDMVDSGFGALEPEIGAGALGWRPEKKKPSTLSGPRA